MLAVIRYALSMASKPKKKSKSLKNKTNRAPKADIEKFVKEFTFLQILLDYTMRVVDGKSEQLDLLFTAQANRIREQMENLKR